MSPGAPGPPADLASRRLGLRTLRAGTPLWRVHDLRFGAVWFGPAPGQPPANRFDAPGGEFRVCYLGLTTAASFAETFLRNPGWRLVDATTLRARALTEVRTRRPLRLARLYGPDLGRLGATAEVTHGGSYPASRQWSLALWSHPQQPDGILYRTRHDDGEVALALFDRREDALEEGVPILLLRHPDLAQLLHRYRLGYDPSG